MKLSQNLKPESFPEDANFRLYANFQNSELHVLFLRWSVRRIESFSFPLLSYLFHNKISLPSWPCICIARMINNFNSHISKTQSRLVSSRLIRLQLQNIVCPTALEYNAYTFIFCDCFLICVLYFSSLALQQDTKGDYQRALLNLCGGEDWKLWGKKPKSRDMPFLLFVLL